MNLNDVMQEFETLGSEPTRKTWRRHSAVEPMFGVKFSDLGELQNRTKVNHRLAAQVSHRQSVPAVASGHGRRCQPLPKKN